MMNVVEKAKAIQEFGTLRVRLKDAGSMKVVERAKAIQCFAELRVLLGGKATTATEEVLSDDPNKRSSSTTANRNGLSSAIRQAVQTRSGRVANT